jgi:HK97 family phage major capsid protein
MAILRTDAAALFQEYLGQEIITQATKSSVALATLPTVVLPNKSQRYPVLATLPQAQWLSGEGDKKPQSDVKWDKVTITAEEIAVIVPVDESVIEDANEDVVSRVTSLIIQEFARAIDTAVMFGDFGGQTLASQPKGGIAGNARKVVTRGADAKVGIGADFNQVFQGIEEIDAEVTNIYAAKRLRGALRDQRDGMGGLVYVPTMTNANVDAIYGVDTRYPLGFANQNSVEAIAVDRTSIMIGIRKDVQVKILDQAMLSGFGSLAEQDAIGIRARMRIGYQFANPVWLNNPKREYPFAVLKNGTPAK